MQKIKRREPTLTESEINKALDVFYAQHHRLPAPGEAKIVPGPLPIVVEVGRVREIVYDPPTKSRKKPFVYKHKMPNTSLVSDPSGKNLLLVGSTYLDTRDGWLKK